ncbi:type II toxin-antitoxin system RelE/ParE family toxin [Salinimicrobium oceani]|uniref:Type II toxin-antitoxin system RelE/ParE family toxin n=1 Tax=Salinimicrobium oceani TaxID=2722702 RepID=A0ABX1CUW1_9FLAO|nr:type II toxin-antitoxin system RelE/ParE family toxin [Salinimicrobium oceani]NJW52069.1 type II toxin-antitoxin system RelE/ParE family toxin [Salinimicrobium oceani]
MASEVDFRKEAQKDLIEAYLWYEKKQKGLGERFVREVENGVKFIRQNPEAFPRKKNGFREFPLKIFPYLMIYVLAQKKITILAIFNTRLNPDKKPSA